MDFDLTRPCPECPFTRGGFKVRASRAREIAGLMLHPQGGTFGCHMTSRPKPKHCAGALVFAEKHETLPQLARIAERLGAYRPDQFDEAAYRLVFDTVEEMVDAHAAVCGRDDQGVVLGSEDPADPDDESDVGDGDLDEP